MFAAQKKSLRKRLADGQLANFGLERNHAMSNVINLRDKRKEHNKKVLERMKDAEDNLCTTTLEDSWYPSRGVFDKKLGRMVPVKKEKEE